MFDIVILTERRYVNPPEITPYIKNVLAEDRMLMDALEAKGLRVLKLSWDDENFDWNQTKYALFRTTWDYFNRFSEFKPWFDQTKTKTIFINPAELIEWNLDKHYLQDCAKGGVHIPPTVFIEQGDKRPFQDICNALNWSELILKPCVSGSGRHTYKIKPAEVEKYVTIFSEIIAQESMMLQEFQHQIKTKGEISLMMFGGECSHAVLKKAKPGDFRVQDDFGGTVHNYKANENEIAFAKKALKVCNPKPLYARIDIFWDNNDNLCLGELELIEPELWLRMSRDAALLFAEKIEKFVKSNV